MRLPSQHSPLVFSKWSPYPTPPPQQEYTKYSNNKANNKIAITIAYSCWTFAMYQHCFKGFMYADSFNLLASSVWTEVKEACVARERNSHVYSRAEMRQGHWKDGPLSPQFVFATVQPFPLFFSTLLTCGF